LRRTPALASDARQELKQTDENSRSRRGPARPWLPEDDAKLLDLAGYEPVNEIAERLGRSERAVRFRMGGLGMSARVTDSWSQRSLRKLLRMSRNSQRNRRAWVSAADAFGKDSKGNEVLSAAGEQEIDQVIGSAKDSVIGQQIVVEGYSNQPSVADQMVASRSTIQDIR